MDLDKIKKELKKELPPIKAWSFSAANEESACSLKRVFEKISRSGGFLSKTLGILPYKGDFHPRAVGSAVHLFMEEYEEYCFKKKVTKDKEQASKIKGIVLSKTELPVEMREDYDYIVDGLIKYRTFRQDVQSWSDQKISFKIKGGQLTPCDFNDKKAIIRSIIDRVYRPFKEKGQWVFVDYKTNRVQFGEDDKEKIKQQKFYEIGRAHV